MSHRVIPADQLRTRPRGLAAETITICPVTVTRLALSLGPVWDTVPAALPRQASGRRRAADFPRFHPVRAGGAALRSPAQLA